MTLTQTFPYRFLPLAEAIEITGWSEARLQKGIENGTIVAGMTDNETLAVAVGPDNQPLQIALTPSDKDDGDDINTRLAAIKREDFAHLEGVPITVSEASREFGVPGTTIRDWIKRGYLHQIEGYPLRLNKAEMAFCAAIYKVRKKYNSRAPLLDEKGNPYLLKEPELARLRRLAKAG